MMRIAMISEHASPLAVLGGVDAGGQNLHVAELSAALARAGHEVTVYTRRDSDRLPTRVATDEGYAVVHVPAGPPVSLPKDSLLPYMRAFGRWIAHHWSHAAAVPDVIHAHFWMSGIAALDAGRSHSVPVVLTYHALGSVKRRFQQQADTSPAIRIAVERQLGLAADRVIAQCPDEVAELLHLGLPADAMTVVPSGVDLVRFSPAGKRIPAGHTRHRILTVGRLVPRKGYEDLARAVASIPEAELVIAGGPPHGVAEDPEGRRLADLAARLGATDRVRLVGAVPRDAMPAWYRSADLLACTPWYEPFGLTPLEAMACGVPVVAYAVGGLKESVVDGVNGLHVPPGDVTALIGSLRDLLADADRRRRYGRAAVSHVRNGYAWDVTAGRIAEVYADAVVRRAEPARVAS